jgi:hypothetical protein
MTIVAAAIAILPQPVAAGSPPAAANWAMAAPPLRAPQERDRERQPARDLRRHARAAGLAGRARPRRAGTGRQPPTRLAVGDVAGEAARIAHADGACAGGRDDRLDAQTARTETSSSYSSVRRLRARNSVLSTAGRGEPRRSPMSR